MPTEGHPTISAYTARSATFVSGAQVASATLNAIQDGAIAASTGLDTLAGRTPVNITGSCNTSDSPAPDSYGGWTVWCEKGTNGTTPVVLDNSRDYRDRYVVAHGIVTSDATVLPGGVNDQEFEGTFGDSGDDSGAIACMGYLEAGSAPDGLSDPVIVMYVVAFAGSKCIHLYARSSDGALCMVRSNSGDDRYVTLKVDVSPAQNHY